MHETAQNIISALRKEDIELSTSQILEQINISYSKLKQDLNSYNKKEIAQIHRKALYHLNRLVDSGIIRIVKHGERGEKFFILSLNDNEEIIESFPKYKKRILPIRTTIPPMPIEGYEQKEIVIKYEPTTWMDRLNSIVVFSEKINDKNQLYELITDKIFPVVNDTINLENFESLVNKQNTADTLKRLNEDCESYGKLLSITINISEVRNKENFLKILELVSQNNIKNINFVFSLTYTDMDEHFDLISKIIEVHLKNKKTFHIKNKRIHESPYFVGKAGPYCFTDKEWKLAEELRKNVICLGCSQSTAIVDVNKFYNEYGFDTKKFSAVLFDISKSALRANSLQRRKAGEFLKNLTNLNKEYEAEFLNLSRNYIRFWNFGLIYPGVSPELMLQMINKAKRKVNEFASAEETIYKSCGMTTRFKIALSCAFETAAKLSPAEYAKIEISDFNDLYKKETKAKLTAREELCKTFDGGNEVTFHYSGELSTQNITRQIGAILSTYNIPLFNYNFKEKV